MFERLQNFKKVHYDDISDYGKGKIKGIAIGIGICVAIDLFSVYRHRKTELYPLLRENFRQALIRKHGHDFGIGNPVERKVVQVEKEIRESAKTRGFRNAFDEGNCTTMKQDLGIVQKELYGKKLGVLGR